MKKFTASIFRKFLPSSVIILPIEGHRSAYALEEYPTMKRVLYVIGILVTLSGGVWFLQGIGLLQGSVMSSQSQWAIIGIVAIIIGGILLAYAYRRPPQLK